jgi:hypothetical protein
MAHRSASVALLLLAGVSRGQEQASMCTISAWTDRSSAVQAACCGGSAGGQGHRRAQDGDCQLPTECPSPECANVFVPFRRDCGDLIATISSVDPTMEERYNRLDASCQSMLSPDDKTEAREPREPSGLCVQEKVVCVGRGNQQRCHVECAGPEDRVDEASCASRLPPSARQQLHDAIRSSPVVLFGTRNDQATSNAADMFYHYSVCHEDVVLDAATSHYLQCLFPHETLMGMYPPTSFVFFDGEFLGNGITMTGIPEDEYETRVRAAGAERTCGLAAEPPPPPPGAVNACVAPGSTEIVEEDKRMPQRCEALKRALPRDGCSSPSDSGPWNDFMGCVFDANDWVKYRVGGQGGCSGPTLFAFCEQEFAGDPDAIRCCSNSRCAWSASLFGDGGGQPACISEDWAVNICCEPCTCWLSPAPADGSAGGSGNMTIIEDGYEGRDYPVLVNSDGLAIAAPFPCGSTGLFGRRGVIQMQSWQAAMGDCSHNPMDGR